MMKKRVLAILLVLVISFVSVDLCSITANSAAVNTGVETVKAFRATGSSDLNTGTTLTNTLTIKSVDSNYKIRINSIQANSLFQYEGDNTALSVSYTPGTIVGGSGAEFAVSGTLSDAGATSIIRYIVAYDLLDRNDNPVWKNLYGLGYGMCCGSDEQTGAVGRTYGADTSWSGTSYKLNHFDCINSIYVDEGIGSLRYEAYTPQNASSEESEFNITGSVPKNIIFQNIQWSGSFATASAANVGIWLEQAMPAAGLYTFHIHEIKTKGGNVCEETWTVTTAYNPNSLPAKSALDASLAECAQAECYSNIWEYVNRLDICAAVALAVHRPNNAYAVACQNYNKYEDLASTSVLTPHTSHATDTKYHQSVTVDPTCTKDGSTTYICVCGYETSVAIPKLGHVEGETLRTKDPTCTQYGEDTVYCSRCNEVISVLPVAMTSHDYDDGTVTKEPTCTTEGVKTYNCKNCTSTYTETIEMLPHDMVAVSTTGPTCVKKGYTTYKCTACSETYDEYDESTVIQGHTPGEWEVISPATCTAGGVEVQYCAVCFQVMGSKFTQALGHIEGDWEVSEKETCSKEGTMVKKCTGCDLVFESKSIPVHTPSYETVVTPPTCTEAGFTTHTCVLCGEGYTADEVTALGHTEGDWITTAQPTCTTEGTQVKKCTVCGEVLATEAIPTSDHSYKAEVTAPTCTETGYTTYTCADCGDAYVSDEVAALGHTESDWNTTAEPTCTTEGTQVKNCTVCGEVLATEVIPSVDHSYESEVTAPTCTEAGYTTYTCSVCGDSYKSDEVESLGHDYKSKVTAPTCTQIGYTTYTCSVCGDNYKSDEVESLGHTEGDWEVLVEATDTRTGIEIKKCTVCGEVLDSREYSKSSYADTTALNNAVQLAKDKINEMTSTGNEIEKASLDALQALLDEAEKYEGANADSQEAIDILTEDIIAAVENLKYAFDIIEEESEVMFEDNFIYGLTEGISPEEVIEKIEYVGYAEIVVETGMNGFGTGSVIKFLDENGDVMEEFTIIIFADANGDGYIDMFDVALITDFSNYGSEPDYAQTKALDLNLDTVVDSFDLAILISLGNMEAIISQDGYCTVA